MLDYRDRMGLRTWIEVDKKAVEKNYRLFRSLVKKGTKLMSVVKSNAYGHGLVDFSKEISKLGADWLAVDSVVEAKTLRDNGITKPILVLGYTLPEMIPAALLKDVSLTVSSMEVLRFLKSFNNKSENGKKPLKVHIKVDTGMCRQGFLERELPAVLRELKKDKNLEVEGLYTHFSTAKNPAFPQFTKMQTASFSKWIKEFKKAGFNPIVHASATAGVLLYPEAHFDMVRIGIGLFGIWPSKESEAYLKDKFSLTPVLSWKTVVSEIKSLPAGSRIGYDGTEVLDKDSKIAVCPIGYWHGYPRALSSIGRVLVGGRECKIFGRVSMDMIVINITGVENVKTGDETVIIGRQGKKEVPADKIAGLSDGSPYEIITRLNPLIKRFYY